MGQETGDGTVGKALGVLDQVASLAGPCGSPSCCTLRFPKPTLYRFVQTLTNQSMLAYDPSVRPMRRVAAGAAGPCGMGHSRRWRQSRGRISMRWQDPWAKRCIWHSSTTGRFCSSTNATPRESRLFAQAGKVAPAYCTGVGKAMLAFLMTSRGRGVATAGLSCLHRRDPRQCRRACGRIAGYPHDGLAFDREEHEPGSSASRPDSSAYGPCRGRFGGHDNLATDLAGLKPSPVA